LYGSCRFYLLHQIIAPFPCHVHVGRRPKHDCHYQIVAEVYVQTGLLELIEHRHGPERTKVGM